tara:strand:- start:2096 stop:2527 length:432 start_codon:yes stop_codon:yes gene_type:complete
LIECIPSSKSYLTFNELLQKSLTLFFFSVSLSLPLSLSLSVTSNLNDVVNSLKEHGVGYTKNTTYVAHGLVGGVIGLTAMSYQAAFKGGDEVAAAYASLAAFTWWNLTAARRVFIEKTKLIGPKINFCISGAMLGLFAYALAN